VPGKKQVAQICDVTDYRPAQYRQPSVLAHAVPGHTGDVEPGDYGSIRGFTVQDLLRSLRVDVRVLLYEVLVIEVSECQPSVAVQVF
jgi:hypothetical protein